MSASSSTAVSPSSSSAKTRAGVAPLRAGQGHDFVLRRLHSLSGIVPVGAFLLEHILYSNAIAIQGPGAYARQVRFLGSLPMVVVLEACGIWLPILFHALYGFYIWYRGDSNLTSYPWQGNWMYTLQRWTGGIAFAYILWHVYSLRFGPIDLHELPGASFGVVQHELTVAWKGAFYMVGLLAASWHFSYGIWLFCAKWGITVGEQARKKLLVVCLGLFLALSVVGTLSLRSFATHPQQPTQGPAAEAIESSR